jgi:hypothetical protein
MVAKMALVASLNGEWELGIGFHRSTRRIRGLVSFVRNKAARAVCFFNPFLIYCYLVACTGFHMDLLLTTPVTIWLQNAVLPERSNQLTS